MLGSWWAYNGIEAGAVLGGSGIRLRTHLFVPWLLMTAQLHALVLLRFRAHSHKNGLVFLHRFICALPARHLHRALRRDSVGSCVCLRPNRGAFLLVISLLIGRSRSLFLFMIRAPKFETRQS